MAHVKKAKLPVPKQGGRVPNMETYFLAKRSGLFQPGQPFILAFAVPSKKPVEPKGRRK